MKILLVEDEKKLAKQISTFLSRNGFVLTHAASIADAKKRFEEKPELVILDCRLPDGEGLDLLREWRSQGDFTPVIALTARAETIDKVLGLESGASDYITKPFDPRELLARIRVQRRNLAGNRNVGGSAETGTLSFEGIESNIDSRCTVYQGRVLELSRIEFDLLRLFIERPHRVFSRRECLASVWGGEVYEPTRTVDYHISMLRKKIAPCFFESVRGIGYRLKPLQLEHSGE